MLADSDCSAYFLMERVDAVPLSIGTLLAALLCDAFHCHIRD